MFSVATQSTNQKKSNRKKQNLQIKNPTKPKTEATVKGQKPRKEGNLKMVWWKMKKKRRSCEVEKVQQ